MGIYGYLILHVQQVLHSTSGGGLGLVRTGWLVTVPWFDIGWFLIPSYAAVHMCFGCVF